MIGWGIILLLCIMVIAGTILAAHWMDHKYSCKKCLNCRNFKEKNYE